MALYLCVFAVAQTGGTYDLSHKVIASGGGSNSTADTFRVDGTIGQAGTVSTGGSFNLRGGFWVSAQSAPTAAEVSISGRIRTAEGRGIQNVRLILTNMLTGETLAALSSTFGYYRFPSVTAGQTYVITVPSKRYTFGKSVMVITPMDEITDADFTADPLQP